MKTYWYSVNYTFRPDLRQLYFKLNKYAPSSDEYIPLWQYEYDHENNVYIYSYIPGAVIYKCENCENAMEAVFKIKSRILQNTDNCNVVFGKSFDELMYEEAVKEYNIKMEEINELFE